MLLDSEIVVLNGNDTYDVLKVCACLPCEYVGDNLICNGRMLFLQGSLWPDNGG